MSAAKRIAVLVVLLAGVAKVHAGIRYTSDYGDYPNQLRAEKWGVAVCAAQGEGPANDGGVRAGNPNAKHMVVQAVQNLASTVAEQVSLETRQELARLADEAFTKHQPKEGQVGNVQYRIGWYPFTNTPAASNLSLARRFPGLGVERGSMPFLAVRVVEAETPK
jgi:hypothetical protein